MASKTSRTLLTVLTQRRYVFTEARSAGIVSASKQKMRAFRRRRSFVLAPLFMEMRSGLSASTVIIACFSKKEEISMRAQNLLLSFTHLSLTMRGVEPPFWGLSLLVQEIS